jgi:hypothetical protein
MLETKEEVKISNLPCERLILFRFYGYHLSLSYTQKSGKGQHPGNLRKPVFRRQYKYK